MKKVHKLINYRQLKWYQCRRQALNRLDRQSETKLVVIAVVDKQKSTRKTRKSANVARLPMVVEAVDSPDDK